MIAQKEVPGRPPAMRSSSLTAPKYRESAEFSRLSPITHTHPSGTV